MVDKLRKYVKGDFELKIVTEFLNGSKKKEDRENVEAKAAKGEEDLEEISLKLLPNPVESAKQNTEPLNYLDI